MPVQRAVKEIAPDGEADSTVYDRAGNPIEVLTRRDDPTSGARLVITMRYDAVNRLKARIVPEVHYPARSDGIPTTHAGGNVPATPYPLYPNDGGSGYRIALDSAVFTYDPTGGIATADNAAAQVARTYYPNGALETETQRIATVGWAFGQHEYVLAYTYDLNGRREDLIHPAALRAGAPRDRTTWDYDATTGLLADVTDLRGNVFEMTYNLRNELTALTKPGGISEDYGYDDDGRLTTHEVVNGSTSPYEWGEAHLRNAEYTYDARGKLTTIENTAGTADTLLTEYAGLGHLVEDELRTLGELAVIAPGGGSTVPVEYVATETFAYDALGNLDQSTSSTTTCPTPSTCSTQPGSASHLYQSGVGRLLRAAYFERTDTLAYDEAGNAEWQKTRSGIPRQDRASYYGADGRLMAADRRSVVNETYRSDFEEYRYDALGRRVWVRSREDCAGQDATPLCRLSRIRRVVWDGDQELYEIQMPGENGSAYLENDTAQVQLASIIAPENGLQYDPNAFFGRVAYTAGLAVDQPLSVIRFGFRTVMVDHEGTVGPPVVWAPLGIVPHWRLQGQADVGTFEDGGVHQCTTVSGALRCVWRDWPAELYAYGRSQQRRNAWHGTLLADKGDGAGTYYRRNRVYDPETGRFTQEDPIGLAGGLNLYGFAGGDPVNFSDPFGLCPIPPSNCFQELANWGAQRGGIIGQVALNAGAAGAAAYDVLGGGDAESAVSAAEEGRFVAAAASAFFALPVGKGAKAGREVLQRAAGELAERAGRNSVSIGLTNGVKRVDLIGRSHGGVPTPHVQNYRLHTNPQTGATRLSRDGRVRPATAQDLREVRRILEQVP